MDYQTCAEVGLMSVRAALSFGQFSKCLCEVPLLFSGCGLTMPFRRGDLALVGCWIPSGKAAERQVSQWRCVSAASLLPALGPGVFQLRSSVSGCQMSRLKKGAAWVIRPPPHISHRHVIPGVSAISPLVTTKTVTSAPCAWLQETGLRGLQQQQLRPKERNISSSHW